MEPQITPLQKEILTNFAELYVDLSRALVDDKQVYLAVTGNGDHAHVVLKKDKIGALVQKIFNPNAFDMKTVLNVLDRQITQITKDAPPEYHARCLRVVSRLIDLFNNGEKIKNLTGSIHEHYSQIGKIWDASTNFTNAKDLKIFLDKKIQVRLISDEPLAARITDIAKKLM